MGVNYIMRCHGCKAIWDLNLGYGLMAGERKNIIKCFRAQSKARVKSMIEEATVPPYGFAYRMCRCDKCGEILSVPSIVLGDKKFLESCPSCHGQVVLLDEDIDKVSCPKCKGKVTIETTSIWD